MACLTVFLGCLNQLRSIVIIWIFTIILFKKKHEQVVIQESLLSYTIYKV